MAQRFCKLDRKTVRRIHKIRRQRLEREAEAAQAKQWLRRRQVVAAA